MHCKYCNKPAAKGGYPDTFFCYSCQRILTINDVIMDPVDPPPKREFDEMDSLSLEKPQPTAQPETEQEIYHKVCRVCKSRVDHSGEGSYYCPQCGMFKDENGVEVGSEHIIPTYQRGGIQNSASTQSTLSGTPFTSPSSSVSASQIYSAVVMTVFVVFAAIIPAVGGTFNIINLVLTLNLWKKYIKQSAPRSPVFLVCGLIATLATAASAVSVLFFGPASDFEIHFSI